MSIVYNLSTTIIYLDKSTCNSIIAVLNLSTIFFGGDKICFSLRGLMITWPNIEKYPIESIFIPKNILSILKRIQTSDVHFYSSQASAGVTTATASIGAVAAVALFRLWSVVNTGGQPATRRLVRALIGGTWGLAICVSVWVSLNLNYI